jgi:hypothetical protein
LETAAQKLATVVAAVLVAAILVTTALVAAALGDSIRGRAGIPGAPAGIVAAAGAFGPRTGADRHGARRADLLRRPLRLGTTWLGTAGLGVSGGLDLARIADRVRTRLERLEGGVRRVLRRSALGSALRRGILARVLTARVLSVVSDRAIGHVLAGSAACLLSLLGQRMLPRMMRLRWRS